MAKQTGIQIGITNTKITTKKRDINQTNNTCSSDWADGLEGGKTNGHTEDHMSNFNFHQERYKVMIKKIQ